MEKPLHHNKPVAPQDGLSIWEKIRLFVKGNPHIWLALLLPFYLILFFAAEQYVSPDKPYWVSYMPIDDKIPFLEWFILPYCLWYPFLVAIGLYLIFRDGKGFSRYMAFLMIGFCSTLLFCVIVPNGQDLRPTEFARENVFTWMVGRIYAADTNTNVFPSMHVIGSIGGVIAIFRCKELHKWRLPGLILAFFICISTVFVKQHSFLDIIGGLIWCVPLWLGVYFIPDCLARRKRSKTE